jgi:predicted dehydrogenase
MGEVGVAIIGASMRSMFMFEYLKRHPEDGFIAGIYDTTATRSRYLLDRYQAGDAVIYESLDQAVSDPRVGVVFVGTPDNVHAEPAVAALRAAKHVYCEKPLATTLVDCDAIAAAATGSKTVFYVGMNLRHGAMHRAMHGIVTRGQLGKVLTIETNEYYYNARTYFRRWNRLRKFGGGLWITKSCHDFDILNWMAGGKPIRVFATANLSYYKPIPKAGRNCRECQLRETCPDCYQTNPPERPEWDELARLTEEVTGVPRDLCPYTSDKDTFDNGIAVVEYDNDIRATHTVTCLSARTTRQIRIVGTEGAAEGDMERGIITVSPRHTADKITYDVRASTTDVHGGADNAILRDFFRCCRTGGEPASKWTDGRLSVQLGLAAQQSTETGLPVRL